MPRSTARQTLAGITVTATAAALLALAPTSASAGLITTTLTSTTDVPLGGYADIASDGGAISVSDQGPAVPYPASTTFTGLQGGITDVNVTLKGITHGSPRDLDVLLVSPTGRMAVVLSDVGGFQTQVNDVDVRLDDEAASAVPAASPLQSGTFRPTNSGDGDQFLGRGVPSDTPANLSVFDGEQANGTWELYIVDDNFDYTGRLNRGWEISVTTAGPAVYPSTIQAAGLPTGITDLDVTLDGLTHTYPADVDLLLVGPGGQQATVLSDVGTEGVYDTDLVLDDEAPSELGQYAQPGRWRPTNHDGPDPFSAPAPTATGSSALSVFDTTDPNGTWRLYAVDDAAGFRGTLSGWSLTIQTEGPVPTSGGATPTPAPTTGGQAADGTAPRVVRTSPAAKATRVGRGSDLTGRLSEAARGATVTGRSVYLVRRGTATHVRAAVSWQPGTRTVVLDPAKRLRAATTYRVVVSTAVRDLAGNRLDQSPTKAGLQPKVWRFTTR